MSFRQGMELRERGGRYFLLLFSDSWIRRWRGEIL